MPPSSAPDDIPRQDAGNGSWSQRLLSAESSWLQQHVGMFERLLWIGPLSPATPLSEQAGVLGLTASKTELLGDLRAEIGQWPFEDDSFDGVVLQHPLEAGLHLDVLIAEAVRVLRPEAQLWLLATGAASSCRFRLASALGVVRWPVALRAGALQASLSAQGCVDVQRTSFAFDAALGSLKSMTRALPWASVTLLRARKRRSANILRPRAMHIPAGSRLAGLPALPASRVGLAA